MLRSVYPVVLGLGGWFLGVLIVLTTMPERPARRRAARGSLGRRADRAGYLLRLGAPRLVGHDQDRRASRPRSAGALVGAWLGFNATDGLLALITTIVGAAVGANLTLLALDIAWDRQLAIASRQPTPRRP